MEQQDSNDREDSSERDQVAKDVVDAYHAIRNLWKYKSDWFEDYDIDALKYAETKLTKLNIREVGDEKNKKN